MAQKKKKIKKDANETRSWFQLETKPAVELGKYLERRRAKVRQERAKKIQDQQANTSVEEDGKYIKRDGVEEIYNKEKHGEYNQYLLKKFYSDRITDFDPNGDFDTYIEDFSDGTFASTPYYFFTQFPPGVVAASFERHAKTLPQSKIEIYPKDARTVIRCLVNNDIPLEAEFEVRQYRFESKFLVSCKRLRGDPLAYKQIIDAFWSANPIVKIMDVSDDIVK